MALTPGTRIGPYEITAPLGAGGMGEVYRAADRKLGRDVAIKILPEEFAQQPERLARFEREARVLASLNHPNIAAIYGLEDAGAVRALVLELVEGQTLAELIEAGPLPVERAMGFALQIAEAMEAAHDKGIIHRDLKPANVKVTPEGVVKVLDFGLAKAFADDAGSRAAEASLSPTLTVAATQMGIIIGTAAYMSPEQAAGQAADRRADIWSFGVVVLEMLVGRRTFGGETVSHVLASVLKDEPEWEKLPPDLPPRLRELLHTCLRKKARRRLQAIGDARVILEEYLADPASFAPQPVPVMAAVDAPARRASRLPWAVAGLLAAGLLGALYALWSRAPLAHPPTRVSIVGPKGETLFGGYGSSVAIAPDGSMLTYVLEQNAGRQLYTHALDRWEPTVLVPGGQEAYQPFFSPDGQWVGFVTRTELKKVPIRGGSPITLCAVDRSRGASWSPDGSIVVSPTPRGGLFRVPAAGGEPEPLTLLDEGQKEASHRWPQVLPGGEAVLFTAASDDGNFDQASLDLFVLKTKERRRLHKGGSYGRYVPSGHVVYVRNGTLFAFPFDLASLEATGSPAPVLEGVSSNSGEGGAQYDFSDDGTLVYEAGDAQSSGTTVVWVDSKGAATPLWDAAQDYAQPAFSPDGKRLAIQIRKEGDTDIWTYDLARGVPMRLSFEKGFDAFPLWSPDGETIYYSSDRYGVRGFYRRPADGSGEAEEILKREKPGRMTSISPDGKVVAFVEADDIWLHHLEGGGPEPFQVGPALEWGATFSPDGRWIVYASNESGASEVYVRPASGDRGKWQISTERGGYPHWSGDGRAIYYRAFGGAVMKATVNTVGGGLRASRPEPVFEGPYQWTGEGIDRYTVAADGERLVMLRRLEGASEGRAQLRVVLNWFEDLRRVFSQSAGAR